MKPECEPCKDEAEEGFSSMFGRELTEKTLYGLFNPESLGDEDEGKVNLNQLIKEQLQEAFKGEGESRADDYTCLLYTSDAADE